MTATANIEMDEHALTVRRRQAVDAWTWFAVVVGGLFLAGTARSLSDPDIWWHVRTGQLILDDGIPRSEPWAFTALGRRWVPTAWLSDVVLAAAQDAVGWRGVIVLTVLLSAALLVTLGRALFRGANPRIAAALFAIVCIVVSPFMAERPQLVSLVLVVWLGGVVRRLLTEHRLSWWVVAVAYAWANLHGMWILVPGALILASLGLLLDQSPGWGKAARSGLLVAAATFVVAAMTPVGPRLAYWPFVVRDAASDVSEWQPTTIVEIHGLAFVSILGLWTIGVARSRDAAPRSEILWMAAVFVFGLLAARNVAPSALLMAPVATGALQRAYGPRLDTATSPRLPRGAIGATVLTLMAWTLLRLLSVQPIADGVPLTIVDELRSRPGTVRVLNSYSVGGVLTGLGAPDISVAIDGRTDNYSPQFVHRHFLATTQLFQWRQLLSDLDPDVVVVGQGGQLFDELTRAGWTTTMVDGDFALLDPPDAP